MALSIFNSYLLSDDEPKRVFLKSEYINIFPCSRRGQSSVDSDVVSYYDPEARLNTERTNRLSTAINGFTDNFIINGNFTTDDTLKFVLAGYYIEAKNFNPENVAQALGLNTDDGTIYAHLSIHPGIYLNTTNYTTEILYRQLPDIVSTNYLDVKYLDLDFFMGVSFTATDSTSDSGMDPYHLPLFTKSGDNWNLVQTSMLPKIDHGESPNSVQINGDLTIKHTYTDGEGNELQQTSFQVTAEKTSLGPTEISELTSEELTVTDKADIKEATIGKLTVTATAGTVTGDGSVGAKTVTAEEISAEKITQNGNAIPAISLAQQGDTWQLQIILDASKKED